MQTHLLPKKSIKAEIINGFIRDLEKNHSDYQRKLTAAQQKKLSDKTPSYTATSDSDALLALYQTQQADIIVKLILANPEIEPNTIIGALKGDRENCIAFMLSCYDSAPKGASPELLSQIKLFGKRFDYQQEVNERAAAEVMAQLDAEMAKFERNLDTLTANTAAKTSTKPNETKATPATPDYRLMSEATAEAKKPVSSSSYKAIRASGIPTPVPTELAPVVSTLARPVVPAVVAASPPKATDVKKEFDFDFLFTPPRKA